VRNAEVEKNHNQQLNF